MMNLAMLEVMAGANFWDAPGHSMAGSNDLPTRTKIFSWIKTNERVLYAPRLPIDPIGVYFSPATRNFHAADFPASYRGILILLMQTHRAFQIVTPRTLQSFSGPTLVMPDVSILDSDEKEGLRALLGRGMRLVVTGNDATGIGASKQAIHLAECPGKKYSAILERDFEHASPDSQESFLATLAGGKTVHVDAGPHVATSVSRSADGKIHVFFSNCSGLLGGVSAVQQPQSGIIVEVESKSDGNGWFLPFMGEGQPVKGIRDHKVIRFSLPTIHKGGVFSFDQPN